MLNTNNYFKIILIIILLIISIILVTYYRGRTIILNNWTQYRCNPLVIPIAGLFGKQTSTNAKKCMYQFFKHYFNFLIQPIQYIIQIIQKILLGLFKDINAFRVYLKPIRLFILNATKTFYDKINGFTTMIVYSFSKMRNTMKRMSGMFRLTLYTLEAMQFSMKSIWDGPIGQVSRKWPRAYGPIKKFFCLHPDTPILTQKATKIPLHQLKIGTRLCGENNLLIGMAKFWVKDIPLYLYQGVQCTGSHMVFHQGRWIRIHSILEPTQTYTGYLYCPSTTLHMFHTLSGVIWRDFEEWSNPEWDKKDLERVWRYHNHQPCPTIPITPQTIGFSMDSILNNKAARDYKINDVLFDSKIIGIYDTINIDKEAYRNTKYSITIGTRQFVKQTGSNLWNLPRFQKEWSLLKLDKPQLFRCFLTNKRILETPQYSFTDMFDSLDTSYLNERENQIVKRLNSKVNHQIVEEPNTI